MFDREFVESLAVVGQKLQARIEEVATLPAVREWVDAVTLLGEAFRAWAESEDGRRFIETGVRVAEEANDWRAYPSPRW